MSKLGDALRAAGQAAKAARAKVNETVDDIRSGAEDVKDAIFDENEEDGSDVHPDAQMALDAMDGMAGFITIVDDIGDAVSRAEEKFTRKGREPDPTKILDAIVGVLEPRDGKKDEDGNDSIRAFFRGMLYSAVALRGVADRDDD